MAFWLVYSLISLLCILLTGLSLVSCCDCAEWIKILVWSFLFVSWFAPVLIWNWRGNKGISPKLYVMVAKGGYFLEGFAFLLLMVLLARDSLWWLGYYLSNGSVITSPLKDNIIAYANVITVAAVFIVSLYGVYAAEKLPAIRRYAFSDRRIKKALKILIASDLHITKTTPCEKVKSWVEFFNRQKADMILFPGDIADDVADEIKKQINELKKIKAPLGIYYTLGNHETYFNPFVWEAEFARLGWQVLHNSGASVYNYGVYVAGVPDNRAFAVNIGQSIKNSQTDEYRILLSHIPGVVNSNDADKIDLMVCGHTHGGQIFPFNYLTKLGNAGMVVGLYNKGLTKVLISRGVGYWGPPMRVGAPNDVIMLELYPPAE